jgi:prefoldin subunit 5
MPIEHAQLDAARAEYERQLGEIQAQIRALEKTADMLVGALAALEALRQLPPAVNEPRDE